jgi:hypothetical protein
MLDITQILKMVLNFLKVGLSKNRLGKIRLSDDREKKYVILFLSNKLHF